MGLCVVPAEERVEAAMKAMYSPTQPITLSISHRVIYGSNMIDIGPGM